MRACLVTLGSPDRQTGGYLFHRRLAEAAPRLGAELAFASASDFPFPLPVATARNAVANASRADVVVIDSIVAAYAAPWLRSVVVPVAGMLHQPPGGIDHGFLRTRIQAVLDKRAYRHMRVLLVASEALAERIRPLHSHVVVVAPGRDVAAAADPLPRDLRAGRDAALLCVGNWVARKGIVELLDAFATLPPGLATLHLVGDDAAEPSYARQVRARLQQLGDRVVAHGVVPKETVAAMYRDSEVFVMPSYREPYGTVYGEAMAAGLPVVGWRAGNLPHLATDGREGLIVPTGDVTALADAMRTLASDESLRDAMSKAARSRARSFPTWEETAALFFSELRRLVE